MPNTAETYLPLETDFNKVMSTYFPAGVTDEERETLKMMFFAGASCCWRVQKDDPEVGGETVFLELLDHAQQMEHVGA